MDKLDIDVIVVGGGPAGSSAARMAAENGCTVALIEKEKEIAETVRTSGVTWISDIKKFGIPEECYNPIKKFSFCSPKNTVLIAEGYLSINETRIKMSPISARSSIVKKNRANSLGI